jgi:hypothetical protein
MARPIRETPILYGEDAERFVKRMQEVESLSKATRAANHKKLMADYEQVRKEINFCIFQ